MLLDFGVLLLYIVIACGFLTAALVAGRIIRPNKPYKDKLTTYECGEDTIGTSFIQFNVRFYVIALIFLIFEVEIVLLFPWAVVYKNVGLIALIEMGVFILILLAGFAYVWSQKDLEWVKSEIETEKEHGTNL
ncbi:MAG: NADH-quinone oxidoreductase subunit A [Planctomycetes bacterium]|nr:NADH-quinone oxidoreductase subunit A [Planctomycetota bacterium]